MKFSSKSNSKTVALEMSIHNRKGRVKKQTQDGRKLTRYRKRWIVARTIFWISNFRRLLVRYENYSLMYQALLHLACIMICIKRFETPSSCLTMRLRNLGYPSSSACCYRRNHPLNPGRRWDTLLHRRLGRSAREQMLKCQRC
jgi:hypothetical protein